MGEWKESEQISIFYFLCSCGLVSHLAETAQIVQLQEIFGHVDEELDDVALELVESDNHGHDPMHPSLARLDNDRQNGSGSRGSLGTDSPLLVGELPLSDLQ